MWESGLAIIGRITVIRRGACFFRRTVSTRNGLPPARQKLIQVADVLKEEPSRQIIVEGHTDSTGSAETNRVLSQRRADSVKEFLVSRGMQSDQITTKGMGPSEPVASNATAEGRANNRRVDIILIPPPSQQKK